MSWLNLEGKTVVVTGGASGIGAAVVDEFLNQGCNVVVSDLTEKESDNNKLLYVKCNVTKRSDVKEIVPEIENILSENNLINIDYTSENNTSSKGNEIEQFFNMLFKKNNNENSERKIKIISQNDVIATATIGNSKYNLYPTRDIEITAIQRPNLNYTVNLNSRVNKNSVGKVVGTYIATDGTLTYSGELIMK